jgi:hypothetical protein
MTAEITGYEQAKNPRNIGAICIWGAHGLEDRVVVETAEPPKSDDSVEYTASETPELSLVKQPISYRAPPQANAGGKSQALSVTITFESVYDPGTADLTIPLVNGTFDISHATLPTIHGNDKLFSLKRLSPDAGPTAR